MHFLHEVKKSDELSVAASCWISTASESMRLRIQLSRHPRRGSDAEVMLLHVHQA